MSREHVWVVVVDSESARSLFECQKYNFYGLDLLLNGATFLRGVRPFQCQFVLRLR